MNVNNNRVGTATIDRSDSSGGRFQILDQSGYQFVALFVVSQPTKPSESPGEGSTLAVDSNGMVITTTEICDFNAIERHDVTVLGSLNVENNSFGDFFEAKTHLGAGDEIFAVGVVAQSAIFRTAEGVETALDVEDGGELGAATDFDDRRTLVLESFRDEDGRVGFADAALAELVVPCGEH